MWPLQHLRKTGILLVHWGLLLSCKERHAVVKGEKTSCSSRRSDFEVVCQVIFQALQPHPGANPGVTALLCFLKAGSRTLKKYKVNDI